MDEIITQQLPEKPLDGNPSSMDTSEIPVEEAISENCGDASLAAPLDFLAIVKRDARAAHFLVDLMSGCDVDDSVARNFPVKPPQPSADDESAPIPDEDALAQAERRGYLRGLNVRSEAIMTRPGAYEEIRPPKPECNRNGTPLLTSTSRTSVWDID
ncbi:MAG: hypothetical protein NC127_02540 [Muribaculum sp.]|nr:hypothetical protein [Muribaculum sp.]